MKSRSSVVASIAKEDRLDALRRGERIHFYRPWGIVATAWMGIGVVVAIAFEVFLVTGDPYPWYLYYSVILFPGIAFLELLYERGKAQHHAIRIGDNQLQLWDWRGRKIAISFGNIQAVRVRKYFRNWITSIYLSENFKEPAWRRIASSPHKNNWFPLAIAHELVRRCGLTEQKERFWVRSQADEIPEPAASWE